MTTSPLSRQDTLQNVKIVSDMAVAWLAVAGLLIAGLFALVQYLEVKTKQAVDQSFRFHSIGWSDPLYKEQTTVNKAWSEISLSVVKVLADTSKPIKQVREEYDLLIIKTVHRKPELENAVDALIDYYDAVATCASTKLCDSDTLKSLLGRDGTRFFHQFSPYICELRTQWRDPTIALATEKYFNPDALGKACN